MRSVARLVVFTVVSASSLVAQRTPVYNYTVPDPTPTTGYSANGNLLSYTDSVNGAWSMQYDSLNRLGTASASAGPSAGLTLSMGYDSFGNRKTQTPSGLSGLAPSLWSHFDGDDPGRTADLGTNRATSTNFAPGGIQYDAAGNVISDGINAMQYDAEGRLCAVAGNGGAVTQYLYDTEGRRVAKGHSRSNPSLLACSSGGTDFAGTESYILDASGAQITQVDGSGNWQHSNVYAGGKLLATYDQQGPGLHFHITDPLGTRRTQIGSTGTVELYCVNLPFGDGQSCTGPGTDATEHHFTGKERDTESGNDYFGARYYASSMGRFLSPDDGSDQSPNDPQSWNLYGYVRNSPFINTDPDGHDCIYADGTGNGFVKSGDCYNDHDNGIYVDGTIDVYSFKYNASNNSSSFNYTPYDSPRGTIGTGVLQGPNLTGGFDPGSLGAGVFGAKSASTWNNAAGVVNAAGGAELAAASFVSTPAAVAVALANCSSANKSCAANLALAALPGTLGTLGKGVTGTKEAFTLAEQLALEEAMANPGGGETLTNIVLKDSRWPATAGWVKKELRSPGGIVVHWVYNTITKEGKDFKLK